MATIKRKAVGGPPGMAETGTPGDGGQWIVPPEVAVSPARVEAIMSSAQRSGLLDEKDGRISGRLSATLIERAKASTGIETDTELLVFALASVALEDKFSDAFQEVRETVDPDLKLGF